MNLKLLEILKKLKKLIDDYIFVSISKTEFNKIINGIIEYDIEIINVFYEKNKVIIKVNENNYLKLKKYFSYIKFKKEKYEGFIYLKKTIGNNLSYIILIILSVLFIIFCSNVIVDIKYNFDDPDLKRKISYELNANNVKKFSIKKDYKDLQEIKKNIKNTLKDDVEWIEIKENGMNYEVYAQKRIIKNFKKNNEHCNVLAKKDGHITGILINKGVSKVNINDYVQKGDELISGDIIFNDEVKSITCAQGTIMAQIWYKINVKVPLVKEKIINGKKKRNNLIINYDDYDIKVFKDRLDNYESKKRKIFDALGLKIYIEEQREIIKEKVKIDQNEAIKIGLEQSKEKVKLKLQDTDSIITEKILQKVVNNSTIELEVFIVTNENIATKNILMEGN